MTTRTVAVTTTKERVKITTTKHFEILLLLILPLKQLKKQEEQKKKGQTKFLRGKQITILILQQNQQLISNCNQYPTCTLNMNAASQYPKSW